MKDEIKEILQELKEKNETYKECSENGIIENEYYKSHILLDYITNLQEENERLNIQNNLMEQNIEDLQGIRDKVIEYINTHNYPTDKGVFETDLNKRDLLNILKGEK